MKIRMNLYLGGLLIGNWLAMNTPESGNGMARKEGNGPPRVGLRQGLVV